MTRETLHQLVKDLDEQDLPLTADPLPLANGADGRPGPTLA